MFFNPPQKKTFEGCKYALQKPLHFISFKDYLSNMNDNLDLFWYKMVKKKIVKIQMFSNYLLTIQEWS